MLGQAGQLVVETSPLLSGQQPSDSLHFGYLRQAYDCKTPDDRFAVSVTPCNNDATIVMILEA
jgi:hypothetical protein